MNPLHLKSRGWRRTLAALAALALSVGALAGGLLNPTLARAETTTVAPGALNLANRIGGITNLTNDPASNQGPKGFTTSAGFPGATATDGVAFYLASTDGKTSSNAWFSWTNFNKAWNKAGFSTSVVSPTAPITVQRIPTVPGWQTITNANIGSTTGDKLVIYVVLVKGGAADLTSPAVTTASLASAPFFASTITYDASTHAWSLLANESWPSVKPAVASVLSAVSVSSVSATSLVAKATLTAGGTPVSGKSVTFTATPVSGAPVTASATTGANGVASATVSGLTPGATYTVTAKFAGDSGYTASASAKAASATMSGATSSGQVTVTVPTQSAAAPTGLTLSKSLASTIALAGSTSWAAGQSWTASGSLGGVTVKDDRQNASAKAWTLNGQVGAFKTSGGATLSGAKLSWTPAITAGQGTAGSASADLSASSLLGTGPTPSATPNVSTSLNAPLSLSVPSGQPAGAYSATLTLTLI